VLPQFIPAGLLVTVPFPVPLLLTVFITFTVSENVFITTLETVTVTVFSATELSE
jgi:hypothetical protein